MQESPQTTDKKKEYKYAVAVLLLIIILSQMTVICYWMTQRTNLFVDEMLSLGYAQSYTFDTNGVDRFYKTSEWKYETWIENQSLREHLEVSDEESLFSQQPLTAINMLLQRRNYFGILNIIMSVFSPNRISAYPGIIFNIFLFFMIQLLIYRITKELTGSCISAILAFALYGFSTMAVNMTLFIRFYSLVIVLLLGVLRIHQIMWKTERIGLFALLTVVTIALLYLALRNSELVFVFAGALFFFFILVLTVNRQYRKAVFYFITTAAAGLFYIIKKPSYLNIIMYPAKYTEMKWPINIMTDSVLNMDASAFVKNLKKITKLFAEKLFGSRYVLFCFAGIILVLLGIWVFRRIMKKGQEEKKNSNNRVFFWAVFGVTFIYLLFCVLTAIPAERYFSLIFPLVSILLFCAVSFVASDPKIRKWTMLACIVLTLYGVFLQQVVDHNFSYIYSGDKKAIQAMESTGVQDAILIFPDVFAGAHAVYDCVYLLPDTAHIYPVDDEHNIIDVDECPDTVLIWTYRKTDIDPYVDELTSGAFRAKRIGRTHASDIYLAQRVVEEEEP